MAKLILLTNQPIEICLDNQVQLNLSASDFDVLTGTDNNVNYFTQGGKVCVNKELEQRLKFISDVNVFDGQNLRGGEIPAFIETGFLSFQGFAAIDSYERINGVLYINYRFKGGYTNFKEKLHKNITDLDLGTHRNSSTNIQDLFQDDTPYDGTNPIWYSLKNYGEGQTGAIPFTEDVNVPASYMRPDIHTAHIIKAIEEESETPIKSKFFQTEFFRRQIHPSVTNLKFVYSELGLTSPLVRPNTATDLEFTDSSKWNTIEDPYGANTGGSNVFGINFPSTLIDDFTVNVKGVIELTSSTPINILFLLKPVNANAPIINGQSYTLTPGLNKINWNFEGEINTEWFAFTQTAVAHTFGVQTNIQTIVSTGTVIPDIKIFNNSILKEETTNDYISAISDLYNLVWFYDEAKRCLIVEPRYSVTLPTGEKVQGFYKEFSTSDSLRTDCENEGGNFTHFQVNRNFYLRFKDDDNDKKVDETTFEHYELLSNKYPDEDTIQSNEVFAATILGRLLNNPDTNSTPLIPLFQHWNRTDEDEDRKPKFDFCNRILYKHGFKTGTWVYEGVQFSEYPFAAQVADGINLGYGESVNFSGVRAEGLAKIFYQTDFDIYNYAFVKSINATIEPLQLIDRVSLFRNSQGIANKYGVGNYILESIDIGVKSEQKKYKCVINVISLNRK